MRQYVLVVVSILCFFFAGINPVEAKKQKRDDSTTAKKSLMVERMAVVSWYKHGKITANGERFTPNGFTVAHKNLPFGTILKFVNPENGKIIFARVNDRGPYIRGREFDITLRCADALGITKQGVSKLKVSIL